MYVFRANHLVLDTNYCALSQGDYFSHSQYFFVAWSFLCRGEASWSLPSTLACLFSVLPYSVYVKAVGDTS